MYFALGIHALSSVFNVFWIDQSRIRLDEHETVASSRGSSFFFCRKLQPRNKVTVSCSSKRIRDWSISCVRYKELEASSGNQPLRCLWMHTRRRFPRAKEPIVMVDHSCRGGLMRSALFPCFNSKHTRLKDSEKEFLSTDMESLAH